MLKERMGDPPFEAVGKLLISIVIWEASLPAATLVGRGGCKGREARTTPRIGDSTEPKRLKAYTLMRKVLHSLPESPLVTVRLEREGLSLTLMSLSTFASTKAPPAPSSTKTA